MRECPRRAGWRYLDIDDGYAPLAFLPRCGSPSCPVCIATERWKWARMVGTASPSRYGVWTGLHGTWQENRAALADLFRQFDRNGYRLRAFYCVERNPKETGYHLNVWWWGPDLDFELAVASAVSVGWDRRVTLKRWTSRREDGYGMKEVAYGMKETVSALGEGAYLARNVTGPAAEYLANNGGRLMHARKGQNSPYRLGVGGQVFPSRETFWKAIREAEGLGPRADGTRVMATWRNGEPVGSLPAFDLPAPVPSVSGTLDAPTGRSESAQLVLPGSW